jgi:hypothetical protein
MALVLLCDPLKYGGNGPIASPSKVVQNPRKMHSAKALPSEIDPGR